MKKLRRLTDDIFPELHGTKGMQAAGKKQYDFILAHSNKRIRLLLSLLQQ